MAQNIIKDLAPITEGLQEINRNIEMKKEPLRQKIAHFKRLRRLYHKVVSTPEPCGTPQTLTLNLEVHSGPYQRTSRYAMGPSNEPLGSDKDMNGKDRYAVNDNERDSERDSDCDNDIDRER